MVASIVVLYAHLKTTFKRLNYSEVLKHGHYRSFTQNFGWLRRKSFFIQSKLLFWSDYGLFSQLLPLFGLHYTPATRIRLRNSKFDL